MATLIFTAIGGAIAGPFGGLVGGLIGQRADTALFGATGRSEGPRVKELAVQISSYGTQVPAIFGAMRVAGTVIWSSDLIERRATRPGGKGRASTVNYSYSVNLAIALSSRPVARVGRIWADGNLMRGAAGDFKVETEFRFHCGHPDQLPDPLIASAEGSEQCPAYRGLCYAVFENLQLADFGNRIPSMTFELFERDGSVLLSEICASASNGLIIGESDDAVRGYALQGSDARNALSALLDISAAQIKPTGDRLQLFAPDPDWLFEGEIQAVRVAGDHSGSHYSESRTDAQRQPSGLSLRYYDADRDYQAGVQASGWSATGLLDQQLDMPAVLHAEDARKLAQNLTARRQLSRDRLRIAIPVNPYALSIGQGLGSKTMRIAAIEHHAGYAVVDCVRSAAFSPHLQSVGDPGRHLPSPDLLPGQTIMHVIELPAIGSTAATEPIIAIAAGGTGAGWKRAAIAQRIGGSLIEVGTVAAPSAIGQLIAPIKPHPSHMLDLTNALVVRVVTAAPPPAFNAGTPLHPDAPYAMIGEELIRLGSIEPLGDNVYVARALLRDCASLGSGVGHIPGASAIFIDRSSLAFPEFRAVGIGASIEAELLGLGDADMVRDGREVRGVAVLPRPPVHGHASRNADGSITIHWIRRTRADSGWADGADVPLSEAVRLFEITILRNDAALLVTETTAETLHIDALAVAGWDAVAGDRLDIAVRQIGDFGRSLPHEFAMYL